MRCVLSPVTVTNSDIAIHQPSGINCTEVFYLSVTASGSPFPHYQWEFNGTTWSVVDLMYRLIVQNINRDYELPVFVYNTASGCEDIYSTEVTVTVFPDHDQCTTCGDNCTGGT